MMELVSQNLHHDTIDNTSLFGTLVCVALAGFAYWIKRDIRVEVEELEKNLKSERANRIFAAEHVFKKLGGENWQKKIQNGEDPKGLAVGLAKERMTELTSWRDDGGAILQLIDPEAAKSSVWLGTCHSELTKQQARAALTERRLRQLLTLLGRKHQFVTSDGKLFWDAESDQFFRDMCKDVQRWKSADRDMDSAKGSRKVLLAQVLETLAFYDQARLVQQDGSWIIFTGDEERQGTFRATVAQRRRKLVFDLFTAMREDNSLLPSVRDHLSFSNARDVITAHPWKQLVVQKDCFGAASRELYLQLDPPQGRLDDGDTETQPNPAT